MNRPCACDRPECPWCFRFYNDPAYKALWNGSSTRSPCKHLGEELKRVLCKTCSGKIELKVYSCPVVGSCTVGKASPDVPGCCASCSYHQPKE